MKFCLDHALTLTLPKAVLALHSKAVNLMLFINSFVVTSEILFRPEINSHTTKVSKGAKIRNRFNQVPHLTQDTNGKVTNSQ